MENQIKQLKATLLCEQFVVTGSYALHKFGIIEKPSDVDIVLVNPTEDTKKAVENLVRTFAHKNDKFKKGDLAGIIDREGTKIDIFYSTNKRETINIDGIEYSKVNEIIKVKKAMGRLKDIKQLRNISKTFFVEADLENFLNKPEESKSEVYQ